MTTKIKICGVTTPEDARLSVELGADYLGLNFYPPSPRALSVEAARRIADAVGGRVPLVGVFVDLPRPEIEELVERVGLDLVQLHGDESPEDVAAFGERAIQVFRTDGDLSAVDLAAYPRACGFLFDIRHPKLYGGTGEAWPYRSLRGLESDRPLFVAGGIRPGNALSAARESRAYALDVCSGVEASPGTKDPSLLRQLFLEIRDGQS